MDQLIRVGCSIGLVGIILIVYALIYSKKNTGIVKKNQEITHLMFDQHKILLSMQGFLINKKETQETFFYEKKKFLSQPVTEQSIDSFLLTGKKDIEFLKNLHKQ